MVWPRNFPKFSNSSVGESPHHINSTHDFVEQIKQLTLSLGECLSSYDVSALFTSVPVDLALGYYQGSTGKKTPTSRIEQYLLLMTLLYHWNFVSKACTFSFQDQFYEQVKGGAMGFQVSPNVASFYMEYFEQKALSSTSTPRLWCRYVDATFVIQKEVNKQDFL